MSASKNKYVLLVPLRYNDGRAVPDDVLDAMLDQLFVLAGGYTIAGTVKGAYRMADGMRQEDESLQVWIAIEEVEAAELRQLVATFGRRLGQEAMYFERTAGTIEWIAPAEEGETE